MPPVSTTTPPKPLIVLYYQTHFHDGQHVSLLPLLTSPCRTTHIILAAIHLNDVPGHITLNDDPYTSSRLTPVFSELSTLRAVGLKILGMLGGTTAGTYSKLDTTDEVQFESYYTPLRDAIRSMELDGLDLDIEEPMSLFGVIGLIDRLRQDFGSEFIITMAPVATAMQGLPHLSGFDYEELESLIGSEISWYHVQFYCNWGDMSDCEGWSRVLQRRWDPTKVVVGLISHPGNGDGWVSGEVVKRVVGDLKARGLPVMRGFSCWEYFNAATQMQWESLPWEWPKEMGRILGEAPEP